MKQTLVVALLALSLALGIFGDLAVRNTAPGLAMSLWIAGVVGCFWLLQRTTGADLVREWKWVAGAAVALGGAFLWRESEGLRVFALLGTGGAFILMAIRGARPALAECGLLEYGHAALANAAHATVGLPVLLFSDARWQNVTANKGPRRLAEIARGLAITVPVLLVIGALFVGADAVFQKIVYSVFDVDLAELIGHLFFVGFVAWILAGYFRGAFIARPTPFPYAQAKPISLGITEVSIVLGSSVLLFVLFLIVQFRYLFGGADIVQVTPSLTYAQYARRGFFELTAVVALVLPLLLVLDWALKKENASQLRIFRMLAGTQVVLLFAVIASAFQRMFLYQQEYGLTELRIYTTAFMGWMALVLIWYVATVLTGRRGRFAFGAVAAAFLMLLSLLAANPDDIIARTNLSRAMEGKPMDARYLTTLSNDAVPALTEGLGGLEAEARALISKSLLKRRDRLTARDWRSWNWSSYAALRALEGREEELRQLGGQ